MSDFVLSCSSTADLSREHLERRNISYICFHYTMDGTEYPDDLGKSMAFDVFYKKIADGAQPTTSQINAEEYIVYFEKFLKEGRDVLHVCLSSGISGTYNSACIVQKELMETYPDRKIYVIDSLAASMGFGMLVDYMADLRDEGKSIDEVHDWAEENKLNVHHWFFSSDLTSFKRGGRISGTEAMLGTLLGICPLMNVDFEGHLIPRRKIRTKKKAIEEAVKTMMEHVQDGENYTGKCYISHSACLAEAEKERDLIEEKIPALKGKIEIGSIGTVIGSHTGPGTVALFFMGDKRVD